MSILCRCIQQSVRKLMYNCHMIRMMAKRAPPAECGYLINIVHSYNLNSINQMPNCPGGLFCHAMVYKVAGFSNPRRQGQNVRSSQLKPLVLLKVAVPIRYRAVKMFGTSRYLGCQSVQMSKRKKELTTN